MVSFLMRLGAARNQCVSIVWNHGSAVYGIRQRRYGISAPALYGITALPCMESAKGGTESALLRCMESRLCRVWNPPRAVRNQRSCAARNQCVSIVWNPPRAVWNQRSCACMESRLCRVWNPPKAVRNQRSCAVWNHGSAVISRPKDISL